MIERRDLGSWLSGPGRRPGAPEPGVRLGLPASGAGSIARAGRRLVAVTLDWLCCVVISNAFFGGDPWATLATFAVVQVLTLATLGSSPGHRLLGLRLQRDDGSFAGPVPALVRTVLLCLVVPALIYDTDGRGMHDRAAGTVLIRR